MDVEKEKKENETLSDSYGASQGGNFVKKALGFPDELCHDKSERVKTAIDNIKEFVTEQIEDGELWLLAETEREEYLQNELRKLHTLIETEFEE